LGPTQQEAETKEGIVYETSRMQGFGVAVLRVVVGIVFFVHGAQKFFVIGVPGVAAFLGHLGIPFPTLSAIVVSGVEFLGGLALLLGLFTRWAAGLLAIDMAVALLTVHLRGGFFVPKGFEFVLTLLGASLALVCLGSGALSLGAILARSRRGP
jgi:putative oxidoreductase